MMVDRAKCDTLLGLLAGYVGELRRLAAIPAAELHRHLPLGQRHSGRKHRS